MAAEKNGKTIHLLKSASKPTPAGRKRQKIPVLGSFGEYTDSKKKAMVSGPPAAEQNVQNPRPSGSSIVNYMAPAPQTKDAKMANK